VYQKQDKQIAPKLNSIYSAIVTRTPLIENTSIYRPNVLGRIERNKYVNSSNKMPADIVISSSGSEVYRTSGA